LPEDIPQDIKAIINCCWSLVSNKRPSLEMVIEKLNNFRTSLILSPEELCQLGVSFEEEGDYTQAYKSYRGAVKAGFFRAKTNIATLLLQGKGCSPNKRQAYQYLLEAANSGHLRAKLNLAKMLELGDGIPKDLVEARKWYKDASENGSDEAAKKLVELDQADYSHSKK
jgi:TPR repeat protein